MLSEPFLQEEARWLEEVVNSKECKEADLRVVIGHINPQKGAWYGQNNVNKYFVPILNKANVNIWLAAHKHQWREDKPGQLSDANFPVIINDDCERLEVTVTKKGVNLKSFDPDGKQTHTYSTVR